MRNYFSQLAKQSGLRFAGQSVKPRPVKTLETAPLHQDKTILIEPDLPAEKTPKLHQQNALPQLSKADRPSEKPMPIKPTSSSQKIETASENRVEDFSKSPESLPPMNPDVSETKMIAEPPSQKEYFKKTGELLETGETNRQEIQQILLQEVHEWVADAPVLSEVENETIEAKELTVQISPLPIEQETVLVRDDFARRQDEEQNLEEQNFSLSIGTISIVIEEAEKPSSPENIPPKMSAESPKGETERQFSRLSRHYL